MRRCFAIALCGALSLAALGCSEDDPPKQAAAPSQDFVADSPAGGPALSLRLSSKSASSLTLQIVGSGIAETSGVAYRLSYDAAVLSYSAQRVGAGFSAVGDTVAAAKESRPGLLVGAVGVQGPGTLNAQEVVLAEVDFALPGKGQTRVDFVPGRSAALDGQSAPLPGVSLLGGSLTVR